MHSCTATFHINTFLRDIYTIKLLTVSNLIQNVLNKKLNVTVPPQVRGELIYQGLNALRSHLSALWGLTQSQDVLTGNLLWAAEAVPQDLNSVCMIRCSDRDFFNGASRLSCQAGEEVSELRLAVQITPVPECPKMGRGGGGVQYFSRKLRQFPVPDAS
ncbi:hypothetical protein T4D_13316 [Trichinella pseudospiralis]|uniref:Uncharacterized protein n=1 Tax=Trichinella pseudospiralis TaxID=6337 RepID=A0A0V1F8R8_TRIPS|nr:hypothetical protein T4D_13316 [Trichinella pseudospiralis]